MCVLCVNDIVNAVFHYSSLRVVQDFSLWLHICAWLYFSFGQSAPHWKEFLLMWHFLPELFKAPLWHSALGESAAHLAIHLCGMPMYLPRAGMGTFPNTAGTPSNWPGESLECACKQLLNVRSLPYICSRNCVPFFLCMHRNKKKYKYNDLHTHSSIGTYMHILVILIITTVKLELYWFGGSNSEFWLYIYIYIYIYR